MPADALFVGALFLNTCRPGADFNSVSQWL